MNTMGSRRESSNARRMYFLRHGAEDIGKQHGRRLTIEFDEDVTQHHEDAHGIYEVERPNPRLARSAMTPR